MEDLDKQQLILLALLVSFVTSLATGIVTVSLMDQAPKPVTQTINRVVEKTIERVVTEPNSQTAAAVMKETIVVKADDLVIDAIEKNLKSLVRIKEVTGSGESRRESFAGLGLILSNDGMIAADIAIAYRKPNETGELIPESYVGVFHDGKMYPLNIASSDEQNGIMFFKSLAENEGDRQTFIKPAFGSAELKLGQAVIAISGDTSNAVSTGIISNLNEKTVATKADSSTSTPETASEKIVLSIKTDIRASELVLGSVLLNLSGEVIGMNIGTYSSNRITFAPISSILKLIPKAESPAGSGSSN